MRPFTNGVVLAVVALLTFGCSGSSTKLDVQAEFDATVPQSVRDQAMRVDTYLVASCADVSMGDPPASSIASTFVLRNDSGRTLGGPLEPGQYGLYAFARNTACVVVAAGCDPVTIVAGMQGPLLVTLTEFTGAGCPSGQLCSIEAGECIGQDGGVDRCDNDSDCGLEEPNCVFGRCSVGDRGDPCEGSGDCKGPLECELGACVD